MRVAIGVAAITFYSILLIAGGQELISEWSRWPVGFIRDLLRVAVLATPVVTGAIAYVLARTLKRSGKEGLLFLSWRDFRLQRTHEQPVPGPPLALDGAEDTEERSLSEQPSWLKRSGAKGER